VTLPSEPVGASVGVEVRIGVERRNTSAPLTSFPRVSFTWIRTVIGVLRDDTGFGENVTESTTSRSVAGTSLTLMVFPPPPPPEPVTVAVWLEIAVPLPLLFWASP
jgi:hypothetical protein